MYRPPPTEFSAIVAGVHGRAPFADHLLQSNLEARRYGSESFRQTARTDGTEGGRVYATDTFVAGRRGGKVDALRAAASDGRVDRWG